MIEIIDFGISKYGEILEIQESLFRQLTESKKYQQEKKEAILIGEHYPVVTLGRRAYEENVLVSDSHLKSNGIDIYHVGRGGDVTYHGPGQLIVYPIIDLEKYRLGVKDYVNILEETVVRLLKSYGIKGERIEGATGVWIGKGSDTERKISAIGVKCSRYCTMHGISLNVNCDLNGFSLINPCGFKDKGVTSMQREVLINQNEYLVEMNKIKQEFLDIFFSLIFPLKEVFNFSK